jgi:hypothetical protein
MVHSQWSFRLKYIFGRRKSAPWNIIKKKFIKHMYCTRTCIIYASGPSVLARNRTGRIICAFDDTYTVVIHVNNGQGKSSPQSDLMKE